MMPKPLEGQMSMVAVHPRTGEAIDLHSSATDELLDCHDAFADLVREMNEAKREIDDELIRRMDHEGRRSFTFDRFKVETNTPLEKSWDVDALVETLDELVDDGLISQTKRDKCLKIDVKPAWVEIKTLLSDPRTRDQLEACYSEVDARRYLKVTRR